MYIETWILDNIKALGDMKQYVRNKGDIRIINMLVAACKRSNMDKKKFAELNIYVNHSFQTRNEGGKIIKYDYKCYLQRNTITIDLKCSARNYLMANQHEHYFLTDPESKKIFQSIDEYKNYKQWLNDQEK